MSFLSNIVAGFNPRGPAVASPSPTPPAQPVVEMSADSDVAPAQDVVFEPQAQPVAEALPPYTVVTVAAPAATATAMQQISLHQFDVVRLQPATAAAVVPSRAEPDTVRAAVEQSVPDPMMDAASIYARAASLLIADSGPNARQRILQSL